MSVEDIWPDDDGVLPLSLSPMSVTMLPGISLARLMVVRPMPLKLAISNLLIFTLLSPVKGRLKDQRGFYNASDGLQGLHLLALTNCIFESPRAERGVPDRFRHPANARCTDILLILSSLAIAVGP